MIHFKPAPRSAQTTIPCMYCKKPLIAQRTCHEAYLRCDSCKKNFPVRQYAKQMDAALEAFLEALFCDRV